MSRSNPKQRIKLPVKKSIEKKPTKEEFDRFMICEDCRHNTLLYEPAKEGACFCGCH